MRNPRAALQRRPAPLVHLKIGRALIVTRVEVRDFRDARGFRRVADRIEHGPSNARRLDPPFAAVRMKRAGRREMILMFQKIGQHVGPAPALQSELPPAVVIGRLAAHIDHRIDRGRAADHLAARIGELAAVEARLLGGCEHPVGAGIADGKKIAGRNMKPDPIVGAAGLDHKHAVGRVRRQTVGENAAGRAPRRRRYSHRRHSLGRQGHGRRNPRPRCRPRRSGPPCPFPALGVFVGGEFSEGAGRGNATMEWAFQATEELRPTCDGSCHHSIQ